MTHPDCDCGNAEMDCAPVIPDCGPSPCGDLDGWIQLLDQIVGALRYVFRPPPPTGEAPSDLCPMDPAHITWGFAHPRTADADCDIISVRPLAFDGSTSDCGPAKLKIQVLVRRCWPQAGKGSTPSVDAQRAATARILMRSIIGVHSALTASCEPCAEAFGPMVVTSSRAWSEGAGAGWIIEASTAF